MKKKEPFPPPDLDLFEKLKEQPDQQNRMLLHWLSDDQHRAKLFALINADGGELDFPSRDASPRDCACQGFAKPLQVPVVGHKRVKLLTRRKTLNAVLADDDQQYSNRIYAELGGGSFMLALDPSKAAAHEAQRLAFMHCFPRDRDQLMDLSRLACEAASIMALRARDFDLVGFAEQSALRFCQKLMGYASTDYVLLETALRASYKALVYQVMGRHFVSDPTLILEAKAQMGRLLTRTSALIDAYATDDADVLKHCKDSALPEGFKPVMQCLANMPGEMSGEQRAILVTGAAIGTVGNVQAAVCIVVKGLFESLTQNAKSPNADSLWHQARKLALVKPRDKASKHFVEWKALLQDLLRQNPPIPFLPRLTVDENGVAAGEDSELLLALGAGTLASYGGSEDPLIWGLPDSGKHWCLGMGLAWPLIIETVRHVMALPGLELGLDAEDATPIGLKKRWGFACESYPLTHRRDERVAQSSLNVAMRLKSPVRDNADRVRAIIRAGAPRIEQALREARHVHFAWFELVESDSVLVLHTVYDGPFEAYIQHFAVKVGDLFDLLFECIEDAPPTPIDQFPNEFVAHIQRYDRRPAVGYFFSAYPHCEVSQIIRNQWLQP